MILICVLCGIASMLMYQRWGEKKVEKKSFVKAILFNFLASLGIYSYYIGYSLTEIEAALVRISPNALYFSLMSFGVGVITVCILLNCDKLRQNRSVKLDYHLTKIDKIVGVVICVLAFLVRFIGIDWGNGESFHPDEGNVVRPPIYMAENNTLMSEDTFYPAQLSSKILSIIYKVWMLIGSVLGIEVTDLSCVYIARAYIVVLSVGIVVCVFLIGNYLKKHAGTFAAAMVAFFLPFVHAAHCVTGDTVVAFLLCLSILCALHYLEDNNDFVWVFLMTLLAVLATLEKYHGMFLFALVALAVCMKQLRKRSFMKIITQGCFAMIVAIISVIAIAPNLCMKIGEVYHSLFYVVDGFEGEATFLQNAYAYFCWFLSYAGVICLIPLIMGAVYFIKRKVYKAGVLGIGFIYIIAMCLQNRHVIRWGYPFYLVLWLFIGVGIAYVIELIKRKAIYFRIIFAIGFMIVLLNGITGAIFVDILFANTKYDTRVPCRAWCLERGIIQEECIYDNRTCWQPGGMVSKYRWISGMLLEEALEVNGDSLVVNHLGKNYAVALLGSEEECKLEQYGIEKLAFFEADYKYIDSSFSDYGYVSKKMLEPYNIYKNISIGAEILKGNMQIGSNLAIYDISMLDSYEKFMFSSFDDEETEEGIIYKNIINSIFAGSYAVEVSGCENKEASLRIMTETGERLAECDLVNGMGQFMLEQDYTRLKLMLMLDGEFDNVKITMQ